MLYEEENNAGIMKIVSYCSEIFIHENSDIARAMSSSRADPVLGYCPAQARLRHSGSDSGSNSGSDSGSVTQAQ